MDQRSTRCGKEIQRRVGRSQKTLNSWWKGKIAHLISRIDDYVKHNFREHNQEADHLANLGAEGQRHIDIEKMENNVNGKRYVAFLAPRLTKEGAVESSSKVLTGTNGSQSAKSQFL